MNHAIPPKVCHTLQIFLLVIDMRKCRFLWYALPKEITERLPARSYRVFQQSVLRNHRPDVIVVVVKGLSASFDVTGVVATEDTPVETSTGIFRSRKSGLGVLEEAL